MNKDSVQNERQPRNTATIRPETLINGEESERLLREGVAATVTASVFNPNQSKQRLRHSQFNNHSLRNKLNSALFDLNHTNGRTNYYSQESPDHINSLIDENIFNNLNNNGSNSSKLNLINNSKSSNNLSNFVSNNNGLMMNGNSSSMNSTSSSSSSVASFSSGYESSMQRKAQVDNNDLDHLFHPFLAPSIYETSTKLLFMTVKWTKSLPLFSNLNYKDQVSLIDNNWSIIFQYFVLIFFFFFYRHFFYKNIGVIYFYCALFNGAYHLKMDFYSAQQI